MSSIELLAAKVRKARLNLQPPAVFSAIQHFESEAGTKLPEDYRDFLLTVADGGREPCRLLALSGWSSSYNIEKPVPSMAAERCIVTPEAFSQGEEWLDRAGIPDWENLWDREQWDPMFGTIAVAEIGCGLYYSMVMTGEYRGRIFSWGDLPVNPPRFAPAISFGVWLESCMDTILEGRGVHFLNGRLF